MGRRLANRQPENKNPRLFNLNHRDIAIISLIGNGVQYDDAINTFYKDKQAINRRQDLKRNPIFLFALAKELRVVNEFKDAGLDETWLAKQLMSLVEDKTENQSMRSQALTMIKDTFTQQNKQKGGMISGLMQQQQSSQSLPDSQGMIRRISETTTKTIEDLI